LKGEERKLILSTGSLTVVGIGIQFVGHTTLATKAWIEQADKVLFAVADPATARWLQELNPNTEALPAYNPSHQRRRDMHEEMVECILTEVRRGLRVCAVFYGHPGVFTAPAHQAIKVARKEGFKAQMLPGISAQACLFADLGVDPGQNGCQSFEATDFLIRRRKFDPSSALILWQIAMIGNLGAYKEGEHRHGLSVLTEVLTSVYPANHEVTVYEAAVYPINQPVILSLPLIGLPEAKVTQVSTLFVPPTTVARADEDMLVRLGMSPAKS
jgi:uncharacterized protein YabN with tetrapyrrole methylase and pyrophosphatase domain